MNDDRSYMVTTLTSSEFVYERGVAGQSGYSKYTLTRTANTIPPVPVSETGLPIYTGNANQLHGVWELSKLEIGYRHKDNSSNYGWVYITIIEAPVAFYRMTINSNGTYTFVGEQGKVQNGTWTFNNGTAAFSNFNSFRVESVTSTTAVMSNFEEEDYERVVEYYKYTFTKK